MSRPRMCNAFIFIERVLGRMFNSRAASFSFPPAISSAAYISPRSNSATSSKKSTPSVRSTSVGRTKPAAMSSNCCNSLRRISSSSPGSSLSAYFRVFAISKLLRRFAGYERYTVRGGGLFWNISERLRPRRLSFSRRRAKSLSTSPNYLTIARRVQRDYNLLHIRHSIDYGDREQRHDDNLRSVFSTRADVFAFLVGRALETGLPRLHNRLLLVHAL